MAYGLPAVLRIAASAGVCVALAIPASPAFARQSNAPPGNAGIQEYVETLPDGSGRRATNETGHAIPEALNRAGVVRRSTRRALTSRAGGKGAAALAEATAPEAAKGGSAGRGAGANPPPLSTLRSLLGSPESGGMDWVLPLLLVVSLLLALGYAIRRRLAA